MTTGLLNPPMNQFAHNKLVSFISSIADDCLRDVYVRGKYRDVILPMVVLRRLDTLLEPTKAAVLDEVRFQKDEEVFLFIMKDLDGNFQVVGGSCWVSSIFTMLLMPLKPYFQGVTRRSGAPF